MGLGEPAQNADTWLRLLLTFSSDLGTQVVSTSIHDSAAANLGTSKWSKNLRTIKVLDSTHMADYLGNIVVPSLEFGYVMKNFMCLK